MQDFFNSHMAGYRLKHYSSHKAVHPTTLKEIMDKYDGEPVLDVVVALCQRIAIMEEREKQIFNIYDTGQKFQPTYQDGVPCSHPGCFSHLSHPCEACGRIGGKWPTSDTPPIPQSSS